MTESPDVRYFLDVCLNASFFRSVYVRSFFPKMKFLFYLGRPTNLLQRVIFFLPYSWAVWFDKAQQKLRVKSKTSLLHSLMPPITFANTRKCLQFVFYQNFDTGEKFYTANKEDSTSQIYSGIHCNDLGVAV